MIALPFALSMAARLRRDGGQADNGRRKMKLAQSRLSASPFLPLRALQCEGQNGHVTIRGRVPTGYLRKPSAMLVKSIDGVRRVTNEVEVLPLDWATVCRG